MKKKISGFIIVCIFALTSIFFINSRVFAQDNPTTITSNWTLQQDETIYGDLIVNGGTTNLNGHTLTVNGTLLQPGGSIYINGGKLAVEGDYRIQSRILLQDGTVSYGDSNGSLCMNKINDYIIVNGTFATSSRYNFIDNIFTAGTLEVKGDFIQKKNVAFNTMGNFLASGTHKVILSGTGLQTISFDSPGSINGLSCFNYLEISNTSPEGVRALTPVAICGPLQKDLTFNGDFQPKYLDLNGHIFTVKGSLLQADGTVDVKGGRLAVEGDFIQSGGSVYVGGGSLFVKGDYRMQSRTVSQDGKVSYGDSSGKLHMNKESDYILVNGTFTTSSRYNSTDNIFTAGTLEVKGDFIQRKNVEFNSMGNFLASGTHKVILSGTGLQTISFESPGSINGLSCFNYLEISNTSPEGVRALTPVAICGPLQKDLTFNGDFQPKYLDLNGYTFTVKGSMIQPDGIVYIRGGRLIVDGDYRIQSRIVTQDGTLSYGDSNGVLHMFNDNDYILVKGTFATSSSYNTDNQSYSNHFIAGTLEVKGDFIQKINSQRGTVDNFRATGTHKVLLSGTRLQTISFDSPGVYNGQFSYFRNLEITNTSMEGVRALTPIAIFGPLNYDLTFYSDFQPKYLDLNGHTFTVKGNLAMKDGTVDVKGGRLVVEGDFIQSGGHVYIRGGSLIVGGDYRIQSRTVSQDGTVSYGDSSGALHMFDEKDYILVKGTFVTASRYDTDFYSYSNNFSAGTLEVKGDFIQKLGTFNNFIAKGTHKVILSGTGFQMISFETPSTVTYNSYGQKNVIVSSQFNTLVLKNSNYRFISPVSNPYYYNNVIDNTAGSHTGTPAKDQISGRDYISELEAHESFWADPVDTATGAHVITNTLLTVNGIQPLSFDVSYNSLLLNTGKLGRGWDNNFEARLEILPESAVVHWSANRKNSFALNGMGYASTDMSTRFDTLIKNEDGKFTLKRKDQTVYCFDASGRLIQTGNKHGQVLNLIYDSSGNLTEIIEPISGQALYISYNGDGLIEKVRDKLNREISFAYDENKNLTGITRADGFTISYTYNTEGRVLTGYGSDGIRIFSNTFDSQGRVVLQDDGLDTNRLTAFSYDEYSQEGKIITNIKDRNGQIRSYVHDINYRLLSITDELGYTTSHTYDSDGNRTTTTDPRGNTTKFTHDSMGNILTITDSVGNVTVMTYDERCNLLTAENPDNKKTVYTYDVNNNLIGTLDPLGNSSSFIYDDNSLLLSSTTPGKGTTAYTYKNGLIESVTDPTGVVITYGYDAVGRKISQKDGLGKTTIYTYDDDDNLTSTMDPLGNKYSYTYDSWGNKLNETDPRGNTTRFVYNYNNKLISRVDPLNNEIKFEYDGEGRLVRTTDPRGNINTTVYDGKGRVTAVIDPLGNTLSTQYDAGDNIISQRDGLNHEITSITYDSLKNPIITKDANGYSVNMEYDKLNRLTEKTDQKGQLTKFSYDALDRLTAVVDAMQNISIQGFDGDGNQEFLYDPNNNETVLEYDLAGRILKEKKADGGEISCTYDSRGLLATKTNGRGQVTTYEYDDGGRLISYTDPEGKVSYTYDENGNILTIQGSIGMITREYDELNRVIKYTDAWGNTIEYSYDAAGNLETLTYPDSKVVKYEYDKANRLIKVTDWSNRVTEYQYDANSRLIKILRPEGSTETRQYDEKGQLTVTANLAADGVLISQYSYIYDETGNIVEENNAAEEEMPVIVENHKMTYGNGNLLAALNDQNIVYDKDGNMIYGPLNGEMTVYNYDARDRLVGAQGTVYKYDAQNNRIAVTQNGLTTRYVVNPHAALSQVLMETDSNGTPTAYYVYGLGILGKEDVDGNYYTYHFDSRGSTIALTNIEGNITDKYSYDAFGKVYIIEGSTPNTFLYNGRDGVMTDDNGLYYMRARYYNPEIKRFINRDIIAGSISNGQGLNQFAYANNNPAIYVDPEGRFAIALGVVGALSGMLGQAVGDVATLALTGKWESSWEDYVGAAVGGVVSAATMILNPFASAAAGSAASSITTQLIKTQTKGEEFSWENVAVDTGIGTVTAGLVPGVKVKGITTGSNSFKAVYKSGLTKIRNRVVNGMSTRVMFKGLVAETVEGAAENVVGAAENAVGVYLQNTFSDYYVNLFSGTPQLVYGYK